MGRDYCIHMVRMDDDCEECDFETELAEADYWDRARAWQAFRDWLNGTPEQWEERVDDIANRQAVHSYARGYAEGTIKNEPQPKNWPFALKSENPYD